jgi:uncharacterized membrane protein YkoI
VFKIPFNPAFAIDAAILALFVTAPIALATAATGGYGDIHEAGSARVSLLQAITAAQHSRDGRAISARFQAADGTGRYVVSVVSYGQRDDVAVDPATGEARRLEGDAASRSEREEADTARDASIDIAKAIAVAEREGGRALGARVAEKRGRPAYRVDVNEGGLVSKVWVDAESGHILQKS